MGDGLKDKMEIFFVSSDRDQASFDEYFAEMPWQALPYEKREEKNFLSDAFGVSGIPAFVVLNNDGTLITTDVVPKSCRIQRVKTCPLVGFRSLSTMSTMIPAI